jgi:hypothetical protein
VQNYTDLAKPFGTVNFSAVEIEKLRVFASAGISMVEAARRLERSPSTVVRRVRALGLLWRRPEPAAKPPKPPKPRRRPAGRPWTDADDGRLRQLVTEGFTIDRAAKDLDRQASLVWRRGQRLGLRWSRSKQPT